VLRADASLVVISPDALDAVPIEDSVRGHDRQTAGLCLSDQDAIERISVGAWQSSRTLRVVNVNRELLEPLADYAAADIECHGIGLRQPAQTVLGCDLPRGCGAHKCRVLVVSDRSLCTTGQAWAAC